MAREQAPAFQFYPRDWLSDPIQAAMSPAAAGAYIRLVCYCWIDHTLPADGAVLARLAGMTLREWDRVSSQVMSAFITDGETYRHRRLDRIRGEHEVRARERAESGKRGAQARWSDGKPMAQPFPHDGSAIPKNGSSARASSSASSSSSASVPAKTCTSPNGDASLLPAWDVMGFWVKEHAPSLPKILDWTDARKRTIRARWREHPDAEWWHTLLARIEGSDFLCGRTPPRDGHASFRADVFWCLKPDNLVKILEGRYDNRATTPLLGAGRTAGNAAALSTYLETLNVDRT
jgi:uncharacterized protein YdaU (DUF1376 family)